MQGLLLSFYKKLNSVSLKKYFFPLFIGISAWLFSFFLYSPRFTLYFTEGIITRRDDILSQCFDPFRRDIQEPLLYYRIVQPTIAKILNFCSTSKTSFIGLLGSPGIAYFSLILSLIILFLCLKKRFPTKISFVFIYLLTTTQFAQWTNLYWGHPDSISFLSTTILLFTKNNFLFFVSPLFGIMNDERFILSIPFIFLWWWNDNQSFLINCRNLRPQIFSIFFSLFCYFLFRQFLEIGLIGPGIDFDFGSKVSTHLVKLTSPSKWGGVFIMTFFSFRWVWVLVILYFKSCINKYIKAKDIIYFLSLFTVILLSNGLSADTSRNIAFAFPSLLIALNFLQQKVFKSENKLYKFLCILLFLQVITPTGTFFGSYSFSFNPLDWPNIYLPLPVNLWKYFDGLI